MIEEIQSISQETREPDTTDESNMTFAYNRRLPANHRDGFLEFVKSENHFEEMRL